MCYDQCGAPKASAFVHCNAGRKQDSSHHKTEQERKGALFWLEVYRSVQHKGKRTRRSVYLIRFTFRK